MDRRGKYYDAVNGKKAAGWRSVKQEYGIGGWEDRCPECFSESMWAE